MLRQPHQISLGYKARVFLGFKAIKRRSNGDQMAWVKTAIA
jgi:hypothetical protein